MSPQRNPRAECPLLDYPKNPARHHHLTSSLPHPKPGANRKGTTWNVRKWKANGNDAGANTGGREMSRTAHETTGNIVPKVTEVHTQTSHAFKNSHHQQTPSLCVNSSNYTGLWRHYSGFGGLGLACCLQVPKFLGSNSAEALRIFQDKWIVSTPSFGGEVKPSVSCRTFAAE